MVLGAVPSVLEGEDNAFAASQTGGSKVTQRSFDDVTFAVYKVTHPHQVWTCTSRGVELKCGDGQVAGPEECEPSQGRGLAGCTAICEVSPGWACDVQKCEGLCGDGLVRGAETCDDGTNFQFGGCSNDCTFRTRVSYVPFGASCAGQDGGGLQRVSKDAVEDLSQCLAECTADDECSAVEMHNSRWKNSVCHHFTGRVPTRLGRAEVEWQAAESFAVHNKEQLSSLAPSAPD